MQDLQSPARLHTPAERRAHLTRELVEVVLFVGIVFLIVQFAIKPYSITSENMTPQLQPDQIIVVNRMSYVVGSPARGDVVVYDNPSDTSKQLIGRVIAVPGDTIAITASQVLVNGTPLNETYVQQIGGVTGNQVVVAPIKLAQNKYWIMNDQRKFEDDSRSFGAVVRSNIIGRAVIVFWPLSAFQGISTYSSVFKNVH